jgi:predicted RNase H-like HicB family nuclease
MVNFNNGLGKKGAHMKLHVMIEKDEAGYYVAEVPALPGCLSQGKTYDEAIANIKEAVEGWLEVMEAKQAPVRSIRSEFDIKRH